MFLVGMFRSRCVDGRVSRAEEDEESEEATRDGEGPYKGSVDGVGLNLEAVSNCKCCKRGADPTSVEKGSESKSRN